MEPEGGYQLTPPPLNGYKFSKYQDYIRKVYKELNSIFLGLDGHWLWRSTLDFSAQMFLAKDSRVR
jgi:hypothetical protein